MHSNFRCVVYTWSYKTTRQHECGVLQWSRALRGKILQSHWMNLTHDQTTSDEIMSTEWKEARPKIINHRIQTTCCFPCHRKRLLRRFSGPAVFRLGVRWGTVRRTCSSRLTTWSTDRPCTINSPPRLMTSCLLELTTAEKCVDNWLITWEIRPNEPCTYFLHCTSSP